MTLKENSFEFFLFFQREMVYNNGFSLEIIPIDGEMTKFTRGESKYVGLNNGTEYKIKLGNHRKTPCDVDITIEDRHIGKWRIEPNDYIVIERPGNIHQKFTFFSETSMEAIEAGSNPGKFTNGLVKAVFYPKKKIIYRQIEEEEPILESLSKQSYSSTPMRQSVSMARNQQYESGVTVLGEKSRQHFGQTRPLRNDEIDWSNVTQIFIRLVARKPRYQQHSPWNVPPRIDDQSPRRLNSGYGYQAIS